MKKAMIRFLAKVVLLSAAFALQACAGPSGDKNIDVASAFESSNVIAMKPYTRTIFSSNDF